VTKPPFTLTPRILNLCSEITRSLGQYEGFHLSRPEPKLRKSNRIRTIQASLAIEGNTLELDHVTAILDGKKVIGSKREILEVQNAIKAYDLIESFKVHSAKSLQQAHKILMSDLIPDAGKWRQTNVGIFQGEKVAHAAPQAKRVPELMDDLFAFIKSEKEIHPLILSAIFHYEIEFIHPFSDGNGRIGRLWQTVLLSKFHPIFEFTPIESAVRERQTEYYKSLGLSDKQGSSTPFIEFSFSTIQEALDDLKSIVRPEPLTAQDRLNLACEKIGTKPFTRKEYLDIFKTLSTATGSRDLATGVKDRILEKSGDKAVSKYRFR
jgi:Fic family protein